MMWGYHGFAGAWPMGMGMLLFWGVVVFVVVLAARGLGRRPWAGDDRLPGERTATDILRERYARGEIDKRDFEERLVDLERTARRR